MRALGLSKFLCRQQVYLLFYGFATARRDGVAENWGETARAFLVRYNIPEEVVTTEALIREAFRMTSDFINEGI